MTEYVEAGRRYGDLAGRLFIAKVPTTCTPCGVQIYFDVFSEQIAERRHLLKDQGASQSEINSFVHAAFEGMKPFVDGWLFGKAFDAVLKS